MLFYCVVTVAQLFHLAPDWMSVIHGKCNQRHLGTQEGPRQGLALSAPRPVGPAQGALPLRMARALRASAHPCYPGGRAGTLAFHPRLFCD